MSGLVFVIYVTFNTSFIVIISYYIIVKNRDFTFDIHEVDQKRE